MVEMPTSVVHFVACIAEPTVRVVSRRRFVLGCTEGTAAGLATWLLRGLCLETLALIHRGQQFFQRF
jgi:hypothetical protein